MAILTFGLMIGAAAFAVVMWKLRRRSKQTHRGNTRITPTHHEVPNTRTPNSEAAKRRANENPRVRALKNAAYGCGSLGNSTMNLLPHDQGNAREDVYESIAEYAVLETQTAPYYITDSEIEVPSLRTSGVHTGPVNLEDGELSHEVVHQPYLELLPNAETAVSPDITDTADEERVSAK